MNDELSPSGGQPCPFQCACADIALAAIVSFCGNSFGNVSLEPLKVDEADGIGQFILARAADRAVI